MKLRLAVASLAALTALAFSQLACGGAVDAASAGDVVTRETGEALTPASAATSINVGLGVPTDDDASDDYIMDKGTYVLSYNGTRNVANWVAWHLDAADLGSADRQNNFRADTTLPSSFYRVAPADYAGSGYDRGHVCPSGDRTRTAALNGTTFLMTNMQPQLHALNAGVWEKMETYERSVAANEGEDVFIIAGGIFDDNPDTIGNGIQVPSASFKIMVVLDAGQGADSVTTDTRVYAAIMPNTHDVNKYAWTHYMTTVDEIERRTGYDFLSRVPSDVQAALESAPQVP